MKRLVDRLGGDYWPVPAACVVVAAALAFGLTELDQGLQRGGVRFAFTGGPESARSLLSTIATAMLSLTALVFSITVVVLQLASSQFSPRTLRTFLSDRSSQLALGVFLATFVYALVALREVRGQDGLVDRFVPGITITVAFALVLLSVGFFVHYINHIAQSIRVATIVERIGRETLGTIDRWHPAPGHGELGTSPPPPLPPLDGSVVADHHGTVVSVDAGRLVEVARRCDVVVRVVPCVGDFVVQGAVLAEIAGGTAPEDDVRASVRLGVERTAKHDVAFGLRQLVDIAERALSPGVNDPSTAVQCLDQIHVVLRALVDRPYPPTVHRDAEGAVRAVVPSPTWADHVSLALDEVVHWGSGSLQVRRRVDGMVRDLLVTAVGERRAVLLERLPLW